MGLNYSLADLLLQKGNRFLSNDKLFVNLAKIDGIKATEKALSLTVTSVKLTPSTAIDPLAAICRSNPNGASKTILDQSA